MDFESAEVPWYSGAQSQTHAPTLNNMGNKIELIKKSLKLETTSSSVQISVAAVKISNLILQKLTLINDHFSTAEIWHTVL